MNRIYEFADALEGWLVEWAEKRQLQDSCDSKDMLERAEPTVAGIGYVEEDGGFVSDWRDAEGITDASAESERYK